MDIKSAPAGGRDVIGRARWSIAIALMLLVLLAPALWNGFPLLQYDTGGYLARWYEGYLVPSRPGAYGLLLAAAVPLHLWPVIVAQAALTIWVLALVLRAHGLGRRPWLLLGLVAVLSCATTLPWLTSILLTDIFAGLAVLALALIIFSANTLGRVERCGLTALIAFAGATHSATLGILLVLAVAASCACLFSSEFITRSAAARAAVAGLLAIVMTLAGNYAVSGRVAWTPGGYGILFGRMLEDGFVTRYLDVHCPNTALKLCPHRHELPHTADEFLWSDSVFNQLGRFAGLGDEMRTIVLGSLREYPLWQAEAALTAAAKQLVRVKTGEGVNDQMWHTYGIIERYTPALTTAMRAARQQHGEIHFEALNRLHVPVALLCVALLPALILLGARQRSAFAAEGRLAATVACALLANALVCGMLANPHDRYGARLVWLAPLALGVAALSRRSKHQTRMAISAGGLTSTRAVSDRAASVGSA